MDNIKMGKVEKIIWFISLILVTVCTAIIQLLNTPEFEPVREVIKVPAVWGSVATYIVWMIRMMWLKVFKKKFEH